MKFALEKNSLIEEERVDLLNQRIEKGLKPIISCILDGNDIDEKTKELFKDIEKDGDFVNYYGNKEFLQSKNIRNAGEETYAISECNEKDKYSNGYYNCTGIVIVGEGENGNQISIMSHQDPSQFLHKNKNEFVHDLTELIEIIKSKAKIENIDALIFGGDTDIAEYRQSVNLVRDIIVKNLKFEPTVLTGPKSEGDSTSARAYFDTQNRRLYFSRSFQRNPKRNESYLANKLEDKRSEW